MQFGFVMSLFPTVCGGNRLLRISNPYNGVHALGGGIGQGLPMAIGAAMAARKRKVVALTGDGGLSLCLGELITATEANINATINFDE